MHTLILHGGAPNHAGVDGACGLLEDSLRGRGWTVETLRLAEMTIRPCTGCFTCWMRTPGECPHQDGGQAVTRAIVRADVVIVLTPLTFGGYGSLAKTALDRIIPTVSPLFMTCHGEMHHRLRYPKPHRFFAVGWQTREDAESADVLARLVERNALNMHAPAWGSLALHDGQPVDTQRAAVQALVHRMEGPQ